MSGHVEVRLNGEGRLLGSMRDRCSPCSPGLFLMGQPVMLIWREGDGAQAQMAVVTGYCLDKIL